MLVFSHRASEGHLTPPGHPERVARMRAVEEGLRGLPVVRREAPLAGRDEILRCHPAAWHDALRDLDPREGLVPLDGDTFLSAGSYEAASRAVGGACAAVDAVLADEASSAFVAARPPGHHAEAARAMGFCLFGTAAIAVKRALDHHGLTRVALVDFDVHHGNGSQALLWDEGRCFFASSHQMPLFPGTGGREERGAHGQMVNVPLRPGSDGRAMRNAWEREILPPLAAWAPELLLVSAGFDAHEDDPLGGLDWEADDFRWLGQRLAEVSGGRVVSVLEGGYDLSALAASVAAYLGGIAAVTEQDRGE